MISENRVRLRLTLGLTFGIALDTAIQLLWKTTVLEIPDGSALDTFMVVLHQPMFFLLVFLMFCQLVNWLKVLDHADLSFAKPITSLSYVSVAVLSMICLGEYLHPVQLLGIGVVLAGVWCITRTEHSSCPTDVVAL